MLELVLKFPEATSLPESILRIDSQYLLLSHSFISVKGNSCYWAPFQTWCLFKLIHLFTVFWNDISFSAKKSNFTWKWCLSVIKHILRRIISSKNYSTERHCHKKWLSNSIMGLCKPWASIFWHIYFQKRPSFCTSL